MATAIVPCHNEASRIGAVLDVLTASPLISQVIVVDDASDDSSADIIQKYDVTLIRHDKNEGKGESVRDALEKVTTDLVVMCDADLIGLTQEHVRLLLEPVVANENVMTIGLRDKYWLFGRDELKEKLMFRLLGGERGIATKHLRAICANDLIADYGLETVMNAYAKKHKMSVLKVPIDGVRDVAKVLKRDRGILLQLEEEANVVGTYVKIQLADASERLKKQQERLKKVMERL